MNIIVIGEHRPMWLLLLIFIISTPVQAEGLDDYDQVVASSFWRKLYPGGGWSLYCGYKFAPSGKGTSGQIINIEHIYPVSRMAEHTGCQSRMQCRESKNPVFMRMEADLHNMYPVWQTVITHRYGFQYGLVSGEDWRFNDCDLEWKTGIVEPRKIARGNIARAMLYMHSRYDIPVEMKALVLFKVWNKIDPPSKQEKKRNNIIEGLQGSRNPYIDTPNLADRRKLTMLKFPE